MARGLNVDPVMQQQILEEEYENAARERAREQVKRRRAIGAIQDEEAGDPIQVRGATLEGGQPMGIQTGGLINMDIDEITRLAQIARGEAPEQMEAQQRRMAMEEQRDAETEKRRFRSTAQMGSLLDQRYDQIREAGETKLQGKELSGLPSMIPGWNPTIDPETGKPRPVYVREEPSGERDPETGLATGEMVFAFYEEDAEGNRVPISSGGGPVRPNRNVMAQLAMMNEADRRERSGIPKRMRGAQAEQAQINATEAKAARDEAEAQYALAGKPTARAGTQFTQKDRQKALLDNQKAYADVLASEQEYAAMGISPPPELTVLKQQLEQQMNMLVRSSGQAVPTGAQAQPGPAARPRAQNPQTGEIIEWDGKAWVPVS